MIEPSGEPAPAQRVVAQALLGAQAAESPVLHGEHPRWAALRAARRLGSGSLWLVDLDSVGSQVAHQDGVEVHTLRISYRLRTPPGAGSPDPPLSPRRPHRSVPRVQRSGAYAVAVDAGRVLLTRLRASTMWTLPGGGIEHGESPAEAVVREVHEEAGLPLSLGSLLEVDSIHYTGQAPDGRWEDYHAIRVVYAGSVPADSTPRVIEVGGSTEEAAWVAWERLPDLRLSGLARTMLTPEWLARTSG